MSEDFNMVAPKKVLIMTRVPLIIKLPGNQTQNFVWVQKRVNSGVLIQIWGWLGWKGMNSQSKTENGKSWGKLKGNFRLWSDTSNVKGWKIGLDYLEMGRV